MSAKTKTDNIKSPGLPDISWKTAVIVLFLALCVSFWHILIPGRILDCGDQLMGIPFKTFSAENIRTGNFIPKWNPHIYGGFPYIGGMHGDVLFPSAFLRIFLPVEFVLSLVFFFHFFIAGVFAYFLSKQLGAGGSESLAVGIMYMFSGIIISQVNPGHDGKVVVEALAPGIFLFISKGVASKKIIHYLLAGGLISLCLLSPNVQLTYYLLMGSLVWFFSESIGTNGKDLKKYIKDISFAVSALALGFAVSAAQFMPFLDYGPLSPRQSGRGWEFATSWSMHPTEFFDVLFRGFSGLKDQYWGQNPFKLHTEYMGLTVFTIAPLAFFTKERKALRRALTLGFLALFFLIVSFGGHTPFYRVFYGSIPGFKQFRAPSISFFMFTLSAACLAALGFVNLRKSKKALQVLTITAVLLCLLILLTPSIFQHFASISEKAETAAANKEVFLRTLILSFVVVILTFVCAMLSVRVKEKRTLFLGILAVIVFFDLSSLTRKFVENLKNEDGTYVKAADLYSPDNTVRAVLSLDSLSRVMPSAYFDLKFSQDGVYPIDNHSSDNYLMANRLYSPGGYHGNQLQRYQDFIGLPNTIMFQNGGILSENINLCRLLGIKFQPVSKILYSELARSADEDPDRADQLAQMFGLGKTGLIRMTTGEIIDAGNMVLLVDTLAFPKIVVVPSCTVITDDKACLAAVHDENFNFSEKVILSQEPDISPFSGGSAQITEYSPDRIRAKVLTGGPALIVVNDNWAPGWKAYIDGVKTDVLRANYTLRCVAVPDAGEHDFVMIYDPLSVKIGYAVTLSAIILWSILVIISWRKKL